MARLRDVIAYICENYPSRDGVSFVRLTLIAYLSDWKSALNRDMQITDIKWMVGTYGPQSIEIRKTVKNDPAFEVKTYFNKEGNILEMVRLKAILNHSSLGAEEKEIINLIISLAKNRNLNELMKIVYSTYPLLINTRMAKLDLPTLADKYRSEKQLLENK